MADNFDDLFSGNSKSTDDAFGFSNESFSNDDFSDDPFSTDDKSGLSDNGFNTNEKPEFSDNTFNTDDSEFSENQDYDRNITGKKALIITGIGVVIAIIIIVVGVAATRAVSKKDNSIQSNIVDKSQVENTAPKPKDATNIMSDSSNENTQQTVNINNTTDEQFTWTEISDSEPIEWNDDSYMNDVIFTITGIKHYARSVDVNNNLYTKTTLTGNLSGLPGTYTIDIPYSKGTMLNIGDSFTVSVQLGSYKDKTVVGEIKY